MNRSPVLRDSTEDAGTSEGSHSRGDSGRVGCPPRPLPALQQDTGQVAAPRLGSAEEAASRARGGGRGGPGITWAEAGPGAPGELSLESDRRLRWNGGGGSSSSLPPFFPPSFPFPAVLAAQRDRRAAAR